MFSNQIELIINNISKLEESITDHIAIINQLEREITIISNKLDKLRLNDRAYYFNSPLFSINRWWLKLDFSIFADDNNMLRNFYRCYNNPMDKIHLGSKGLRELESMILKRTSIVNTRSYSSVVRS